MKTKMKSQMLESRYLMLFFHILSIDPPKCCLAKIAKLSTRDLILRGNKVIAITFMFHCLFS